MRFALVNDERTEAKLGLKGICPGCSQPVIAKCGNQRIHHWAHGSNKACDSWSEPETEWHRAWKNNYPLDWQEVILPDKQTGEKHIADIQTGHSLVIEFQHSHLDPKERLSREKFHQNMIWVVDGTRLKRDYPRFLKEKDNFRSAGMQGFFFVDFLDECFPKDWVESSVPVIFDFLGTPSSTDTKDAMRNALWCLLPGRVGRYAVVVKISRTDFVNRTSEHLRLLPDRIYEHFNAISENLRQQRLLDERLQANMYFRQYERRFQRGKRHFRF